MFFISIALISISRLGYGKNSSICNCSIRFDGLEKSVQLARIIFKSGYNIHSYSNLLYILICLLIVQLQLVKMTTLISTKFEEEIHGISW